jgi:hypothetical protein
MLYVVLTNGAVEQHAGATAIVTDDGALICTNKRGEHLRRYEPEAVLLFSHDKQIKAHASMAFSQAATP